MLAFFAVVFEVPAGLVIHGRLKEIYLKRDLIMRCFFIAKGYFNELTGRVNIRTARRQLRDYKVAVKKIDDFINKNTQDCLFAFYMSHLLTSKSGFSEYCQVGNRHEWWRCILPN